MKRAYRKVLTIAIAFCMAFAANGAFAGAIRGQERPGRPPKEERVQKIIDELGLTEEQVQQIKQNKIEHQEQAEILQEKMKQIHTAIRTELLKETSNEKTLKELADELKSVQAAMVDHRIESLLRLKDILTPEQFAQFTEKMEQVKKRFSGVRKKIAEGRNKRRGPWTE